MSNPILVEVTRGALVESVHRGAIAIAAPDGEILASLGDAGAVTFPRSAIKMMQALPLVASGAADAMGLSEAELALACASHGAEPFHVAAVEAWLARIGASESDLLCGPHPPSHEPSARALFAAGGVPRRVHNNCSGKHTGFLTLALHLKVPLAGYVELGHPVQRAVRQALCQCCGVAETALGVGVDGCCAPNYALPLAALARGMAALAAPETLPQPLGAAARRLHRAVRAHPLLGSGHGRADALMIGKAGYASITKAGAEGIHCAIIPERKLGVAIKIDDGAGRASETAIANVLAALGVLDANEPEIASLLHAPVVNTGGTVVGERRAAPALREAFRALR